MRKYLLLSLLAISTILTFTSCQKEENDPDKAFMPKRAIELVIGRTTREANNEVKRFGFVSAITPVKGWSNNYQIESEQGFYTFSFRADSVISHTINRLQLTEEYTMANPEKHCMTESKRLIMFMRDELCRKVVHELKCTMTVGEEEKALVFDTPEQLDEIMSKLEEGTITSMHIDLSLTHFVSVNERLGQQATAKVDLTDKFSTITFGYMDGKVVNK